MARRKPTPIAVFEDNIADAQRLIGLTRALLNTRKRRMRTELRDAYGDVMGIPRRDRDQLDCVESVDAFVILKPGGAIKREHFTEPELRPLLRQAIVAISAAVEAYVYEKACTFLGEALDEAPNELRKIRVTLGDVFEVENTLVRRRFGWRRLIQEHLEREASPSPMKIDYVFKLVGKQGFWNQVDERRGVPRGTSRRQLEGLYARRNRIAHVGDRQGTGRAHLSLGEVDAHLTSAKSIIEAFDSVVQ